jgi:hypothetical protein
MQAEAEYSVPVSVSQLSGLATHVSRLLSYAIYLSAIGLTPSGSSTVHIYLQLG